MNDYRPCLLLISVLFFVVIVPAQVPVQVTDKPEIAAANKKQLAAETLSRAVKLYREGNTAALPEFEKALAMFRANADRSGEAITLGLIGNCYKRLGDFPKALDFLQRALAIKRELGDRVEEGKTLSHLGLLFWEMGRYSEAIEHHTKAVNLGRELKYPILEASARNNIGMVYDELGEYRKSAEEYNRALALYRSIKADSATADIVQRGMSDAIGNLGGAKLLVGEYGEALPFYEQALAMDERLNLKAGASLDLQNIGLCYIGLGRAQESLTYFDRAIKLADEAGIVKQVADSKKGKGSALVQLGKYTAALVQYRAALQTYERAGLKHKQSLTEALGDLGNLELRLGDIASAEKEFREALRVSNEINHPRGVIKSLLALGNVEWQRKRFDEAASQLRQALKKANEVEDRGSAASAHVSLALTLRSLNKLDEAAREAREGLELARAIQSPLAQAEALYALGEIARAMGKHGEALEHFSAGQKVVSTASVPELSWRIDFGKGQSLEALNRNEEALESYRRAVSTIEQVRSELREERFRAGYIEDKYQVYVALVQLLLKLKRPGDAFMFAEKLRARSYLDLLERGHSRVRNQSQRQQENLLQNRTRLLQKNLAEETAKPAGSQKRQAFELFSRELVAAERQYQSFLESIALAEPAYATARSLRVPAVETIQAELPAGTALIEYVVGEKSLTVFVIRSNGLNAMTLDLEEADLSGRVRFLRELLLRNRTDEWKLPAAKLHQQLIAPIVKSGWLRDVNRIYIVPHSVLHYLPFAVLKPEAGARTSLVDQYVVAYLPAAAALVYGRASGIADGSLLAMAPANLRLTHTKEESQNVAAFFPKQRTLLVGARATESAFKKLAGQQNVIHLATHGYFNKFNPIFSGLELEADTSEDGRLEVHEILELKLNARLVTLSACDTALGSGYFAEVPAGDDIVGLTRAFLFAGTPSVLASLWEVNDRAAVGFMNSFYSGLRRSDKATALAITQRQMNRRGVYRHPYYWAAFSLTGRME